MIATHGNGVHYQNIGAPNGLSGPSPRSQAGPANQFVLPPIAPRPSPPISQNGTTHSSVMDANGAPTDQYGLFGYSFDGRTFEESDLPPRMRQHPPLQDLAFSNQCGALTVLSQCINLEMLPRPASAVFIRTFLLTPLNGPIARLRPRLHHRHNTILYKQASAPRLARTHRASVLDPFHRRFSRLIPISNSLSISLA